MTGRERLYADIEKPATEGGAYVVVKEWILEEPHLLRCADEVGIYNAAINEYELS